MKVNKNNLLIEIRTEELPSGYIAPAVSQIEGLAKEIFERELIQYDALEAFGTPRRLILFVKGCSDETRLRQRKVSGPALALAYGPNKEPTPALVGFMKRLGIKEDSLAIEKTQKGEFVIAQIVEPKRKTNALLKDIQQELIKSIGFPKTMRWDDSGMRFARPIEWTKASFGPHVRLPRGNIILGIEERKGRIRGLIENETKRLKSKVIGNEALLNAVTNLVESPFAFSGRFDTIYLSLPEEVLSTSMASAQRLFAVADEKGKLRNFFIAVTDGRPKALARVRRNYENVLNAKLKDSKFFFAEDLKVTLEQRVQDLSGITFFKDLGTVFEKVKRLKALGKFLADELKLSDEEIGRVVRTAQLCKADLLTQMVGEFPELQGTMGGIYALENGEDPRIAKGISEHYLPRFAEDALPQTTTGRIVGIADKLDSLVGFWLIGLVPSGSFDPFGLRRDAMGVVKIVLSSGFELSLDRLINESIKCWNLKTESKPSLVAGQIVEFLKERLKVALAAKSEALLDGILASGYDNILNVKSRLTGLESILSKEEFARAAKVAERTKRILKGAGKIEGGVESQFFTEDMERRLWQIYLDNKEEIEALIDKKDYVKATGRYGNVFFEAIHQFFDKVLVMTEDESLRRNRLAMMRAIYELYAEKVADLSGLAPKG